MSVKTQLSCDISLDAPGKRQGYLRAPRSDNEGGWSAVPIPITVIAHGRGPTLLGIGGTHGDELEGPVALMKLARGLQPEEVSGRVILIPALNLPAVRAGARLSPLDGMNMNRAFPGDYNGSITSLIAHYLTNVLFPLADIVMDIHSGGRSMVFYPCATLHRVPDDAQYARMLAAARVWGARYVFIYADVAGEGLLPVQAERMGKLVVTTEMGGGGECHPAVLRVAERGIRNVMIQQGLLAGEIEAPPYAVETVAATDPADYIGAPADGLYESFLDVGDAVTAGQAVGQVHFPESATRPPEPVVARTSGVLIGRRAIGATRMGDNVATIARPVAA
ncbi:MAG: succinylglutamate desuccinylase/aspartoacylase family protein [Chloroflexota bacterium]